MKRHIYFQPNKKDLKDEIGDCAIRAMCKALDKTWIEIFDGLVPYARDKQCLLNQKPAYEAFLKDHGFEYKSFKRNERVTVEDFAKKFKGTAICYVRVGFGTHLVTASGGKYYDTLDSGNKIMYGYYTKTN